MHPRLSYNLFTHITPVHESQGYWRHPKGRHMVTDYDQLEPYLELAKSCERGFFDTIFFADLMGANETYQGSAYTSIRAGTHFPSSDPSVLISALATVTENLGFVITSGILQAHPFEFARRMSTLDILTKGRVGWNVVTSYLDSTARNMGLDALPDRDLRYDMAEDYLDVVYKLWESSWDDAAVVDDVERNVMFEPSLVREINHSGAYYRSAGPHLTRPTPQRTPVLYQAGISDRGKQFASRHIESMFIAAFTPEVAAYEVADLRRRAVENGRHADDLGAIAPLYPMIGSTEEEARRRLKELHEWADYDAVLAQVGPVSGVDFSVVDPDRTIEQILADPDAAGIPRDSPLFSMVVAPMLGSAPDPSQTFRTFVTTLAYVPGRHVGTPEQIADIIEGYARVGVAGFNVTPVHTLGWIDEWVEHVVPVLQKRGLLQREYVEGTLREKLSGRGPYLPEYHPARQTRGAFPPSAG